MFPWGFSVTCSVVSDSVTQWIVVHQDPPFMEFSRQGYWSGLPFPPPRDLPNPGIKRRFSTLQVGSLPSKPTRETQEYWKQVAFSFSRGSFQPRNQTRVSGITSRFFTRWATSHHLGIPKWYIIWWYCLSLLSSIYHGPHILFHESRGEKLSVEKESGVYSCKGPLEYLCLNASYEARLEA